jgi:hypothetical protein
MRIVLLEINFAYFFERNEFFKLIIQLSQQGLIRVGFPDLKILDFLRKF